MTSSLTGRVLVLFPDGKRRPLAVLVVALTLAAVLETVGLALILPLVQVLGDPDSLPTVWAPLREMIGTEDADAFLLRCGLLLVFVYAAKNAFTAAVIAYRHRVLFGRMREVATDLLRASLDVPFSAHLRRNSAAVQRLVDRDAVWAFDWVVLPALTILADALVVALVVVALIALQPVAALPALLVLGVAGGGCVLLARGRLRRLGAAEREAGEGLYRTVSESLGGLRESRTLGRTEHFVERYDDVLAGYVRARSGSRFLNELPRLALETAAVLAVVAVIVTTLGLDESADALPALAFFAAATFRLLPLATRITRSATLIRQYRGSLDAVADALRPTADSPDDDAPAFAVPERIAFEDVTFAYDGEPVLASVSFEIRRGERVGLAGPSGAGKSTVVDLLLGLLSPDAGRVTADGVDIATNLRGWRHLFGLIPQDVHLLDDTLRRNVAFGLPDEDIDDDRVRDSLRRAQLLSFVRSLDDGLDHVVGERGVRLSGGQRQRLGIARALHADPAILVLDEATSAVDVDTEARLVDDLFGAAAGRTVVIVAHRPETLARCERVIEISPGTTADPA